MTFSPDRIEDFLKRFDKVKQGIIDFDGCELVELNQDRQNPCIFFTYSHWTSEDHLNRYRNSDFFKEVWSGTRTMFSEKAEAWSVDKIVSLRHPESFNNN
jgi:heme-degrading monooxygenase HmoA